MIGLNRMHFIISISSSDKHGYFELHDNVINMLPVGIYDQSITTGAMKNIKSSNAKHRGVPYNTQF